MAIQRLKCPQCGKGVNVPAAMASVKCPSCGRIWKINDDSDTDEVEESAEKVKQKRKPSRLTALLPVVLAGMLVVAAVAGGSWWWINREPPPPTMAEYMAANRPGGQTGTQPSGQPVAAAAEPYREIDLPESQRKQIYADYRTAVKGTVGKPLPIPQASVAKQALDATMAAMLEREVRRFAAAHDVTEDDIAEVIKEGNAKQW